MKKILIRIKSLPFKKIFKWSFYLSLFLILLIYICNSWIIKSTRSQIYSDITKIPKNDVGLLLGANKKNRYGGENLYFKYRIEAAVELFKKGKIKHIIVSGDNHIKEYDEATDMYDALVEKGIPDTCITLDFAGFRTFDSMIRCNKVFGQNKFTVISQEFRNQRAVFIGNYYKMNVVAYNAKEVPSGYSFRTKMREYFAKCKAVLDLYLLDKEPKFLGEEIKIKI